MGPQIKMQCSYFYIYRTIYSALLTVGISAIATLVAGGGLGDFIKSGLARLPLPNSLEAIWTGVLLSLALAFVIDSLLRGLGRATTPRTKKA